MLFHSAALLVLWCLFFSVVCQEVATFMVKYKVYEEVPEGTVIGRLPEDLGWKGRREHAEEFQLMQHPSALPVRVGFRDGSISTEGRLDREQLCRLQDPCLVSFDVLATKALALIHVQVQVLDINDHDPWFPKAELELEISESASLGTRIPLDRALDLDSSHNALQSYHLSPNEHFSLVAISNGSKHAELVVVKELDREFCSSFDLVLTAVDQGEPPKSGSTLIRINVLDSNDNSPVFGKSSLMLEISEDTSPGTLILNLTANDPDQGPNGEIEYSFSKHVPPEVVNTFGIDATTGSIVLTQPLDYEVMHAYEVDVQARDLGPNPIPTHCKILVKVLDVNDNAPQIHITWTPQDTKVPIISEALPKDSFVALVTATDPDSGKNGQVQCDLSQSHGHFRIRRTNGNSYILLTNATLDRERWEEYNLTVLARDQGIPSYRGIRHLTVHVSDANDNAPIFERNTYDASISENNLPFTHLLTVKAHDADLKFNSKITYSIHDSFVSGTPVSKLVSIHPSTGEIFAVTTFDHEKMTKFEFLVLAEDGGQPTLSSNASITVSVNDENDNYPVIVQPVLKGDRASITVLVNSETGLLLTSIETSTEVTNTLEHPGTPPTVPRSNIHPVLSIVATDADSGLNGDLMYDIVWGNDVNLFALDQHSGQVYVNVSNASSLIGSEWELEVMVRDQGNPPLHTKALLKLILSNHHDHLKNLVGSEKLSLSVVIVICLAVLLVVFLLILALIMSLCRTDNKDNRAYNCREAESTYRHQPKRPQRQIQKTDIHLVPVLRNKQDEQNDGVQTGSCAGTPTKDTYIEMTEEDLLQTQFHMTPTLYRTLRNQSNQATLDENMEFFQDTFNLPSTAGRAFHYQRQRSVSRENLSLQDPHPLPPTSKILKNPGSPQVRSKDDQRTDPPLQANLTSSPSTTRTLRRQRNADIKTRAEKDPHHQILRSLVRLSMAALAERDRVELTMESPHVQQISQLLSLLHQGQVHPRPNHRGNKYTTKSGRATGQDADWLSTKDSGHGESEAGDLDSEAGGDLSANQMFLEEGLESLLDPEADLNDDNTNVPDPAWMARLSLPLTANYKDNIFSPASLNYPDGQHPISAAERHELKTFLTFGKANGDGGDNNPGDGDPRLTGTFLAEMSSLFEMLLTQKAESHADTASEVLLRLSACSKTLGMDIGVAMALESEIGGSNETLEVLSRSAGNSGAQSQD
ncbi:protocadherin-12 [Microcaecilia unicolor]|uniref:Protocadherin-12 n=1 Tax=Microcaecilia unicolor TaxID=1415580 RepID=A0A6P7YT63_9AMPH|nr:protocadherin-12 [Microcaecilia unicolor]